MKGRFSNKVKYTLAGALLGFAFLLGALYLHAHLNDSSFTFQFFLQQQKEDELIWVIDTAPIVLAIAIGYAGRTRDFYQKILDNLPSDIAVFDQNHRYVYVNPSAIKDKALRRKIIGMNDYEYCAYRNRDTSYADERRKEFLLAKQIAGGLKWEETIKDAAGNRVTNLRRFFPINDRKGKMLWMVGYAVEITDRKVLEEKQEALIKRLEQKNNKLNDFSSIIAHNIRGPMTNMSAIINLLDDTDDPAQQKELQSYLKPCIEGVSAVLNQLVDSLYVMQDTDVEYRNNLIDDCLNIVFKSLDLEIKKCGASVQKNFSTEATIYAPEKYILSILHNLVSNALKYRAEDRKPEIIIAITEETNELTLSVKDNGLGIDLRKNGDKLFKIGKVFHNHTDSKGFGLFMTKSQVESMNGKIWVESEPGNGATFFIQLKNKK